MINSKVWMVSFREKVQKQQDLKCLEISTGYYQGKQSRHTDAWQGNNAMFYVGSVTADHLVVFIGNKTPVLGSVYGDFISTLWVPN